jgi:hypothetical protein
MSPHIGTSLALLGTVATKRGIFVNFLLFLIDVFASHLLDCDFPLLESFQLCKSCLFCMSSIMCKQKEFLEIMLLAPETVLNGLQLTIVSDSFLPQPSDDLVVGLLNGLRFVILDHDLIKSVLKYSDSPHHGVFLDVPQLVILNLFQFILQSEQDVLFYLGLMFLLVQHYPQVVLISGVEPSAQTVSSFRKYSFVFFRSDELVSLPLQLPIFTFEFLNFLPIFLLDLFSLFQENFAVFVEYLVFLMLVAHLIIDGHGLLRHRRPRPHE